MWLFFACISDKNLDTGTDTPPNDTAQEDTSPEDSGVASEPSTEETGTTDTDIEEGSYVRMTGSVTWTLTFDEEAQANGFETCSYRRSYEGEQRIDHSYLCPDCEIMVQGVATMEEGGDCHAQISSDTGTQRTELWGLGNGSFFRSGHEQRALGALGEIAGMGADQDIALFWESDNTLTAGGTMHLEAVGTTRYTIDPSIVPDPDTVPHEGVYACGWPQNDPGTLVLDYHIDVGKTFPNVHLMDQCGERLSLWDLYGHWLILDTTQSDCGPCRSMAGSSEEALQAMRADGIDVMMVSFLGNGLSAPFETPSQSTFNNWVETYNLQDPVLFDEGFAFALFPSFVEEYTGEGFGYPTWLLVNPEMTLVHGNVGFGNWDSIRSAIEENQ